MRQVGANDLEVAIFASSIRESLLLQFNSLQFSSLQFGGPQVGSDRHNFDGFDRFDG
jgi:hypothetical protein